MGEELQRLAALLIALKNLEIELGNYSHFDSAEELREAGDHLQALREHVWPRWVALGGIGQPFSYKVPLPSPYHLMDGVQLKTEEQRAFEEERLRTRGSEQEEARGDG